MRIRWYGQSAFLLAGEKSVFVDPFGDLCSEPVEPREEALHETVGGLRLFHVRHPVLQPVNCPVLGHHAEPRDAGVLERGGGVEAAGDGVANDRLSLLLQQRDQPLGLNTAREIAELPEPTKESR